MSEQLINALPTRFTLTFAVAWLLFCALAFSDAGHSTPVFLLTLITAAIWGIVWLVRLAITFRNKAPNSRAKKTLLYWLFEPVAIVLPLVLALSGVFLSVRFALSENALNRYAEDVRQGKVNINFEFNHPIRRAGLYVFNHTDMLADGSVRILTSSHGLMDRAGFVNSPNNPPQKQGEDFYQPIHEKWWL